MAKMAVLYALIGWCGTYIPPRWKCCWWWPWPWPPGPPENYVWVRDALAGLVGGWAGGMLTAAVFGGSFAILPLVGAFFGGQLALIAYASYGQKS